MLARHASGAVSGGGCHLLRSDNRRRWGFRPGDCAGAVDDGSRVAVADPVEHPVLDGGDEVERQALARGERDSGRGGTPTSPRRRRKSAAPSSPVSGRRSARRRRRRMCSGRRLLRRHDLRPSRKHSAVEASNRLLRSSTRPQGQTRPMVQPFFPSDRLLLSFRSSAPYEPAGCSPRIPAAASAPARRFQRLASSLDTRGSGAAPARPNAPTANTSAPRFDS
jgi:hypothetical protein